ncbi:tyrosine-type recombinase/integrase [Undibacterium sp. RTI2.1]|uniref:tyrosine-type recombinase/integrase n=2 Tax=Undibacterium TaxID=401469 RepID=UPI002AB457FC|nr:MULTISPECIES: tyrosine-type recombinase/integrase [unclassified Undibacterium]MDY7540773.1 tyrosine-type recombinase/integrase [Undibacterium sp. 5I1]MEB0032294.1 tyrosine-type recombinase/integrase [Undibacterium sp. RTI2.1]MEB0118437.1 tyrosine-type recombinase/integrase [Undibacterium sp. RTI2.2]MEB0259423.1 tyrosine-type recombinase/integrase [Undibacterium sp. 5I1]
MNKSLFDDENGWKHSPREAFSAFVKTEDYLLLGRRQIAKTNENENKKLRPILDSSAEIYIHMFHRFMDFIDSQGVILHSVNHDHIKDFLEIPKPGKNTSRKAFNSSIRVRYLRLLERVFAHVGITPNPAKHAAFDIYQTKAQGRDLPKVILTDDQQHLYMEHLPEVAPYDLTVDDGPEWKRRRDRAILAMLLGAGLKVSELVGLNTDRVGARDSTGSIPVEITPWSVNGTSRNHQTQLRPFAVADVMAWVEERNAKKIPGKLLFPANLDGKKLDKSTIYLLTKATYKKAGIEVKRKGPRTLRNSFAVRELESPDGSIELTGELLGLRKRKSTEKYLITNKLLNKKRLIT